MPPPRRRANRLHYESILVTKTARPPMASPNTVPEAEYQRLREQFHELAQLAGALAHEIKNPLSTIRLNMDLLAEDFAAENGNGKIRRASRTIETVRNQCARLEN